MAIKNLGESVIKRSNQNWSILLRERKVLNDHLRRKEPCSRSLVDTCPARVPVVAESCPDLVCACDRLLST